jgi:hypothetical protein
MARMCRGEHEDGPDVEWAVRDTLNQYLTLGRQHRLSRRGRLSQGA